MSRNIRGNPWRPGIIAVVVRLREGQGGGEEGLFAGLAPSP